MVTSLTGVNGSLGANIGKSCLQAGSHGGDLGKLENNGLLLVADNGVVKKTRRL